MERNEWSICSWLSSLNVRVVAKSPRRIPSFRMVGSPRTFRSVASLLKPATGVSFSSIVTRSENIERPTVSSDKYHKYLSRTDLAALHVTLQPYAGSIFSNFPISIQSCRSVLGASAPTGASVHVLVYRRAPNTTNLRSLHSSALVRLNTCHCSLKRTIFMEYWSFTIHLEW